MNRYSKMAKLFTVLFMVSVLPWKQCLCNSWAGSWSSRTLMLLPALTGAFWRLISWEPMCTRRLLSQEREGKWYGWFPKYPGCCPLYLRNQHSDVQLWEFTSSSTWGKWHTYSRDWGGAHPWALPRSLSQPVATFLQGLVVTGLHGSSWDLKTL